MAIPSARSEVLLIMGGLTPHDARTYEGSPKIVTIDQEIRLFVAMGSLPATKALGQRHDKETLASRARHATSLQSVPRDVALRSRLGKTRLICSRRTLPSGTAIA